MMEIPIVVLAVAIAVFRTGIYAKISQQFYAFITQRTQGSKEKQFRKIKQKLFKELHQMSNEQRPLKLLEIGTGSGLNFEYLPAGCELICLEPKASFDPYIKESSKEFVKTSTIEIMHKEAGDLDMFEDDYFDGVIITHLLCVIHDEMRLLRAINRVLKPGRSFYFLEHVCAEEHTWLYLVQRVANLVWPFLFKGCETTKRTGELIQRAGFATVEQEYVRLPIGMAFVPVSLLLFGTARK